MHLGIRIIIMYTAVYIPNITACMCVYNIIIMRSRRHDRERAPVDLSWAANPIIVRTYVRRRRRLKVLRVRGNKVTHLRRRVEPHDKTRSTPSSSSSSQQQRAFILSRRMSLYTVDPARQPRVCAAHDAVFDICGPRPEDTRPTTGEDAELDDHRTEGNIRSRKKNERQKRARVIIKIKRMRDAQRLRVNKIVAGRQGRKYARNSYYYYYYYSIRFFERNISIIIIL